MTPWLSLILWIALFALLVSGAEYHDLKSRIRYLESEIWKRQTREIH